MIMMVLTTTRIYKIAFVMAPMTRNHQLNMNLIYLMIELMCSHNHNTGLFVVVGWLEFVVVSFVDVGELALVVAELMVVVTAVHIVVPRVANQPGTVSDTTDFENPNNDKLFKEKEGPDRLSMLVETPLEFLLFFF